MSKQYLAKDGTPITEEQIAAWAQQAEDGFSSPGVTLHRESDPFVIRRNDMRAHTIRVPEALWRMVERVAQERNITASEFTRQALDQSLARTPLTRDQKIDLYAEAHGLSREEAINRLLDSALS
ncbi:hypothetical protein [Bifidobacterium eulemuris]|nr:hypothetical protein [Bifidobacterium eulemuris]QOL32544.1 hypothetical protein BE0216_08900 [Bifidobacterium eulemuris]